MKPLGPCAVRSFVAQSHTPCNRCVRFAAAVASDHATLATKRTLLLTWAGLAPAGSHQLCLAHLFDHLVDKRNNGRRNGHARALWRYSLRSASPFVSSHSITSSARARSVGGISRPSALAVLTLMTISNF